MNRCGFSKLGYAIYCTGCWKAWKNGNGSAFVWRWWHPLTWVLVPIVVVAAVLTIGIPETIKDRASLGLGISDYWKQHKKEFY